MKIKKEERFSETVKRISDCNQTDCGLNTQNITAESADYACFELAFGFGIANPEDISPEFLIEELESFDPVNFPVDEIEMISIGAFNPMRYNIRRSYLNRKYYRLGNSGKILVLYSGEELRKKFRAIPFS